MARKARYINKSGIYHIVLKGNEKPLFKDNEDKNSFLTLLRDCGEDFSCDIYGYCLLDFSCSLLVKANDALSALMKSIEIRYANYYNGRYGEKGRLFKDRFKSISVESDEDFAENLRYIHQLPQISKEVDNFAEFEYSSFDEYTDEALICETDYAKRIFGSGFMNYHRTLSALKISKVNVTLDDETAEKIIFEVAGKTDIKNSEKRDEYLVQLKEKGLSIRQIARLTGVNRGTVFNAKPAEKETEIFLL